MNKSTIAGALCFGLLTAGSAHAATLPLAKVRTAMPTLHPVAMVRTTIAKVVAAPTALPGLPSAKPIGLSVAGINVLGKQGTGLLAGVGVMGSQNVGHGIVGAGVLSGANSGAGLVGIGALSGIGSGAGSVLSVGVKNAGQTALHVGVLGNNVIGH